MTSLEKPAPRSRFDKVQGFFFPCHRPVPLLRFKGLEGFKSELKGLGVNIFRGLKDKSGPRPVWEKFYPYIFILFLAYSTADILILAFRDRMLPTQPPPSKPKGVTITTGLQRGAFNTIISRNIFSSDGIIPPALQGAGGGGERDLPPIPSTLQLTLVGTLVHSNPEKSIAAIDVKSKNQVLSFTPTKEIEGLATVEKVERMKVIIRNLNTNRLEYLEIKADAKVSFGASARTTPGGGGDLVKKISDNEFQITKSNLQAQLNNLPDLLRQAKAMPAYDASGNIYGFRITQIEPGSIYTQLGIENGCVITGVNENPITSAQQAMEMYATLKSSANVQIQTECEGRRSTKKYNVTQ
jgi:general secretion pathway protein C